MNDDTHMVTSPLSEALYSVDWAVRFDEFRKYNQSSYNDIHQLLADIDKLVESQIPSEFGDLSDTKVLTDRFNKAKTGSTEWYCLSMLIHSKIIMAAIPKGLTATATLSAIQIMESMWKIVEQQDKATTSAQITSNKASTSKPASNKPAVKPVQNTVPRKKPKAANPTPVAKKAPSKPAAKAPVKSAANKKNEAKTENVVIKKLAAEAGLDEDKILEAKCYEIASSLAEEYPEYTLTAIRVMTAEKLGVTRQFVENLDIKPARFKSG